MTPKIKRQLRHGPPSSRSLAISKLTAWAVTISGIVGATANAILAAVGYNFRHQIRWLRLLLCWVLVTLTAPLQHAPA